MASWNDEFVARGKPELLEQAARKHDVLKPQKARLSYDSEKEPGNRLFQSYREHAQGISTSQEGRQLSIYERLLIQNHHSFELMKIAAAVACMNRSIDFEEWDRSYPRDLYILICADWVDSAIASSLASSHDNFRVPSYILEPEVLHFQEDGVFRLELPLLHSALRLQYDVGEVNLSELEKEQFQLNTISFESQEVHLAV